MKFDNNLKFNSNFSESENLVKLYIENNPNKIEMLTINKLAANAGTSIASAQRYFRKIGYKGYKDFKYAFLSGLKQKDSSKGSFSSIYVNGYKEVIDNFKNLNKRVLNNLVDSLLDNHPNYSLGIYFSSIPAHLLALELQDLGLRTYYADDYTKGEHLLVNSTKDSTIIVFSITGAITHYEDFWGEAISQCSNSYLITMNKNAQLKRLFKNTIVLPGIQLSQKMPFDAQSIPSIFVELIGQLVYESKLNH
ncbi:DNA-binding MurR/RpiR family transcriptional regulator [Lactobacillus colini]|uniref:DNA-binding MurR/RpiR family transcriptional regulator n=1 Tax=Lactobacillus colini TaxID=1819254 RepID=A0ABS4MFN4_9LACO|nr:MurR/RpiR family transcriptional regulator [Lactobacillus colini]MBP2058494.1 DNA-binding MurR/RpiR family transcriptional regulator [Lactobacillus colini]